MRLPGRTAFGSSPWMTCTGEHREFEGAPSSLRIFLAKGREEKEQKEDGCLSSALLTEFSQIFKIHYYFSLNEQ